MGRMSKAEAIGENVSPRRSQRVRGIQTSAAVLLMASVYFELCS